MTDRIDRLDEAAADWVARMDAALVWTVAEEEKLQAWLGSDPEAAGALLRAQALWEALSPADEAAKSIVPAKDAEVSGLAPPTGRLVNRRRVLIGGGAAALAASFAGAGLLLFAGRARYTTEIGEIRRVPLPDGSFASINTASSIQVEVGDKRRQVKIARGEAWFQVAKDPARPFLVEAGRVRVQAVGTAFSVRRRDGGAEILVTEGVVEAWADGAEGNRIRLAAGQRAFVADDAAIRREAAAPSSVDRTLAWRSGRIDLAAEPLAEAAAEFNRYNRRQIVIVDPALGSEQFDGVFGANDPQGFARTIQEAFSVPVDLSNPDEIRIGRPPA